MSACRVRVTGHVQGVFFRAWTREEALRLGVRGWVRNCSDGSVEAHLEGPEPLVEELIAKMRIGPPNAKIEQLSCKEAPSEDAGGFELRH